MAVSKDERDTETDRGLRSIWRLAKMGGGDAQGGGVC